jgi:hypothetical protein
MKLIFNLLFLSVLIVVNSNLGYQDDLVKIRKFAEKFESDDSLSRVMSFEEFDKEIPATERAEFLVKVWDFVKDSKTETGVRLSILAYLVGKEPDQMPWNDNLRDRVMDAGKSKEVKARRVALNTLIKRKQLELRSQILSFLNDENEDVRELVLVEISRWPNAEQLLESYIRTNTNRSARSKSVNRAQFLLNKRRGRA